MIDLGAETPMHMTLDEVEAMLVPLIHQHMQDHRSVADAAQAEALQAADVSGSSAAGLPDLAPIFSSLRKLVRNHVACMKRAEMAGIPLPEVDGQLTPLQLEVEAVLQRLAGHRQEVPAVMAAALEQQLQQLQPSDIVQSASADQTADDDVDGNAAEDAVAGQPLMEAEQLHQALITAVKKLPTLRARLEEIETRLGRNLTAADEFVAAAEQPPRTVEKVLRGQRIF